jgi:peptidoglycan/xylan/chitin deacetylase (PgdA/CDA1 family)
VTRISPIRQQRWAPVREELARWQVAGLKARLWLRDDDAIAVTPALERLVRMSAEHGIRPLIASIPAHATRELAAYVAGQAHVEIAVHGWQHTNHAPPGTKAQEFPPHRPREIIVEELTQARDRLSAVFGGKVVPSYVPPWNRIAADIAALLPELGFRAVSGFGHKPLFDGSPPLAEINTHVDIIDWRGTRGGRDPAWLAQDLARELALAREQSPSLTIGILTHHLVHDDLAWVFLDELFAETAGHPAVRWCSASEMIP